MANFVFYFQHNRAYGEYDVNVIGAWESGITGHGVTVCVIDDGLEWKHPDLRDNYNAEGSYDLNADDADPSPIQNGGKSTYLNTIYILLYYLNNDSFYKVSLRRGLKVNIAKSGVMVYEAKNEIVCDVEIQESE